MSAKQVIRIHAWYCKIKNQISRRRCTWQLGQFTRQKQPNKLNSDEIACGATVYWHIKLSPSGDSCKVILSQETSKWSESSCQSIQTITCWLQRLAIPRPLKGLSNQPACPTQHSRNIKQVTKKLFKSFEMTWRKLNHGLQTARHILSCYLIKLCEHFNYLVLKKWLQKIVLNFLTSSRKMRKE